MPAFDFVLAERYRLVAPLGEGGMATVYRARDLRLNREVAVKILHDNLTRDPEFLARFEREAQVVAGMSHPNIVPVYDVGEEDGTHFIVMEYVRGKTLRDAIELQGRLPAGGAIAVMLPILNALGYAHTQGLIHRDIKPQNILLTTDGTPRLADFGIVRLVDGSTTRTAVVLGSAHYLSPEQARGEEATIRSDIYACGIVLYEMLSGRPPFEGPNPLAIASQHVGADAVPLARQLPDVSSQLDAAIMRALSKDPARRFPDAASFAAALEATSASGERTAILPLAATKQKNPGAPQTSPAQVPQIVLRRSARKSYLLAGLLACLLVLAAYVASLPIWGGRLPDYPSAPYALFPAALATALSISWISTRSWKYTMDTDAAVVQWGLIGHHRFGVPIRTITTVELKQSPIDRLVGVGTVELCARDGHGAERRLIMEDLPHPRKTYEELMQLLSRTSRTRPRGGAADRA